MKITAVHVETLELAMEEPFVIASSALASSPCDLIRVETDEGLVGLGEACPAYEFTGDTLWTVQDVIGEYLGPVVIGKDPFQLEAIVHCWERELYTVGTATPEIWRCAVGTTSGDWSCQFEAYN